MADPAHSWTETERLGALARTGLFDTPPERDFDELVQLTADLLGTQIAAIHLVDAERQWGKSVLGLPFTSLPREIGLCTQAMTVPDGLIIPDARSDPRFADSPVVTGPPHLRFYAGQPLYAEGLPIGALCVIDTEPRPQGITERQHAHLRVLAGQVSVQIALRRALAEKARAAAHARQIIDSAADFAIVTADAAGRITGWNSGARNVLGWSEAQALGRPAGFYRAPETSPDATEGWMLRQDGARVWAASETMPLLDHDGATIGTLAILRDRTARRAAAAALAASEERLQLASSAGLAGFWDWDIPSDTVRANAEFASLFGVAPAQAEAGLPFAAFTAGIHPDDRARVAENLARAVTGCAPFEEQCRLVPSGRWLLMRGRCITDEVGRPLRFPGVAIEITRRKAAEEEAAAARDTLQVAVQAAGLGSWDYDPATGRCRWDPRLRAMAGLPEDTEPDMGALRSLTPAEDWVHIEAAFTAALDPDHAGPTAFECRILRPDNGEERWLSSQGQSFFAGGRCLRIVGFVQDVTERKRAELALREMNTTLELHVAERTAELVRTQEALLQSQKMEAVGQLTGGLAHDFNNLLTGVMGNLELLSARLEQGRHEALERYVAGAQASAKRAAALTHRLLAFSRRQTLDPKPTDLNRLVAEMEELIRRTVGPSITLEVAGVPGLWPILVDPHQLENALLNLCINARDAMPGGGVLRLETANQELDARAAAGLELASGQHVTLRVSDTGAGMTSEVLARAFDPFFTTKPIGQGTGLGLSMVYGFARQSGGQVRIASVLGQGTSICLTLPRHHGTPEAAASPAGPSGIASARAQGTVLVVDDEPTVRMLVSEVMGELGYNAIEAGDGPAGLRALQSAGQLDLLITDVGLPGGMNGRQLADAARALRPTLKVLLITGYAESAVLGSHRLEAGMQVLAKPFSIEALATRVGGLVHSEPGGHR